VGVFLRKNRGENGKEGIRHKHIKERGNGKNQKNNHHFWGETGRGGDEQAQRGEPLKGCGLRQGRKSVGEFMCL